jgi:phospholipid-binding lipoprotein MlaA
MRSSGVLALAAALVLTHAAPGSAIATGPAPGVPPAPADPFADELAAEIDARPLGFPDPLERMNRSTLRLNQGIDRWVLDPVTTVYRFVVPDPARQALRRVLRNLNSPSILVNDLLQGEWEGAGTTVARFMLNTTLGVAGVLDPAARFGLAEHTADFGQTLALAGVGSGPFLMLPVLGPTTARDGVGTLVDVLFRPTFYVLGPADQLLYSTIYGGSAGLATFEEHTDALDALEDSSVDYYAALRNAYYQDRMAQIWHRRERGDEEAPAVADGGAAVAPTATTAVAESPRLPLELAGGEVGDLAVEGGEERPEAVALEH